DIYFAMESQRLAGWIVFHRAVRRIACRRVDHDWFDGVARLPAGARDWLRAYGSRPRDAERADTRDCTDRRCALWNGLRPCRAADESGGSRGRRRWRRESAEFRMGYRRGGMRAAGQCFSAASLTDALLVDPGGSGCRAGCE